MLFFHLFQPAKVAIASSPDILGGVKTPTKTMKKLLMLLSAGAALAFVSCASAPSKGDCCGTCKSESSCKKGCDCEDCQK
jgi:hypothetical protein